MTRRSTSQFRSDRASTARRSAPTKSKLPLWLRVGVFGAFVAVVAIVAVSLVIGRSQPPGASVAGAIQVRASMEGFDPNRLTVTAGQKVDIQFASMDTDVHSDGGG
jgi:plastocyanin